MKKGLRLASFPLKFVRKGPFMRNDDFQDACPRGESLAILFSEMAGDPDSEEGCSWLRALVAFANTQGGSLCVGMDSRTRMAKPLSQEEADRVQLLAWRLLSERSEPVLRPRIEAIVRVVGRREIIARLNLSERVSQAIERQKVEEFHDMINAVASQHLGAIQVLGYILGGVVGALMNLL